MVIIIDLKKKEGIMKDIIAVPMVLIGFILAVMTSGFWILIGFSLIIVTILFGFKKRKKKVMLRCPKTSLPSIDPDSQTVCVKCSKRAYGKR